MEISIAPLTKGILGRTPVTIGVASGKEKNEAKMKKVMMTMTLMIITIIIIIIVLSRRRRGRESQLLHSQRSTSRVGYVRIKHSVT